MHEPVAKPECIVPLEKDSHTPCQMLSYTAAMLIHPTLRMQSWGFVIGALLFALGSAPVISTQLGTVGANTSFFVGSWFFTAAAFVQLMLSGAATATDSGGTAIRGEWLASFIQFIGTLLFNVSTGAALYAHTVKGEMHLVWNPNVEGSLCFLVSSALAVLILWRCGQRWEPRSKEWQSGWLNMLGSIAFGVSAAGASCSTMATPWTERRQCGHLRRRTVLPGCLSGVSGQERRDRLDASSAG